MCKVFYKACFLFLSVAFFAACGDDSQNKVKRYGSNNGAIASSELNDDGFDLSQGIDLGECYKFQTDMENAWTASLSFRQATNSKGKKRWKKRQKQFLKTLNQMRLAEGLQPLKLDKNGTLARIAQHIAYDNSALLKDLDHEDSKGRGFGGFRATCGTQLSSDFSVRAENILYRFDSAVGDSEKAGFFNQWFNSEGHKKNMFNGDYSHIGFGFFQDADSNRIYMATIFGVEKIVYSK